MVAARGQAQAVTALRRGPGPNPFRPAPAVDPRWLSWNDGTVAKLARAVYDERRFADLPILADALEDAGCTDAAVLAHCRSRGEHVRGVRELLNTLKLTLEFLNLAQGLGDDFRVLLVKLFEAFELRLVLT